MHTKTKKGGEHFSPFKFLIPAENAILYIENEEEGLLIGKATLKINKDGCIILKEIDGEKTIEDILNSLSLNKMLTVEDKNNIINFLEQLMMKGFLNSSSIPFKRKFIVLGKGINNFPVHATVELTERCNLICKYCYRESSPILKSYMKKPIEFLENIYKKGVRILEISGGEPLLHPQIRDILKFVLTKFNHVALLTNGTLLKGEILKICKKHSHNIVIQVSLPSMDPERYYRITGKYLLDKVLDNIKEMEKMNLRFRLGMVVIDDESIEEIEKLVDFSYNIGAMQFVFTPMINIGRGGTLKIKNESFNKLITIVEKMKSKYPKGFIGIIEGNEFLESVSKSYTPNCGAGFRSITFDSNRVPRPCPLFPVKFASNNWLVKKNREIISKIPSPSEKFCLKCKYMYYCKGCILRGYLKWEKIKRICVWGEKNKINFWWKDILK